MKAPYLFVFPPPQSGLTSPRRGSMPDMSAVSICEKAFLLAKDKFDRAMRDACAAGLDVGADMVRFSAALGRIAEYISQNPGDANPSRLYKAGSMAAGFAEGLHKQARRTRAIGRRVHKVLAPPPSKRRKTRRYVDKREKKSGHTDISPKAKAGKKDKKHRYQAA